MGTGWRRAFCTTIPRDSQRFFKSNPSTPRFNSNGHDSVIGNLNITPRCKTPKSSFFASSSPRSPFSIFKTTSLRSNCGVCLQGVKAGAIFTAECSHTFHFPCISEHVENTLACPVCKTAWRDASFLQSNQLTKENLRSKQNFIQPKAYDDDEPLQTPILPIPAEEDVDDEQEFKGFFVNSALSSSADEFRRDVKKVEVMLLSEVAIISSNQSHQTYAFVLKVKAPPPPLHTSRRAPIDLVAVLDVSATMAGPKLQMLKRAMHLVISSLASSDRLSILAFSASPKRLMAFRKMSPGGQRSARRIIDQLACSRGTCAGEALKIATKVLEDRRERNPVASIILLSDGHVSDNNNNNTYQRQKSSHTRFAHVEIPVRTLEKTGRGGYSHENAFTKCVGGLLRVVSQDLRIELGVAVGSDPGEITAVYSCNGNPMVLNTGSIRFGDLYAEEEREVLVELRVPRSKSNTGHSHHVLSARCCYKDPATQQVIYGGEKALLVPRLQSVRSPKTERLRNLFIATRAVAESRLLVEHNKLRTAHHLLSSARDLLMQSASGEEFVKGLESELLNVEGVMMDGNVEPTWAEKLAKVAVMKKPLNRVRL